MLIKTIINPVLFFKFLYKHKYIHFFVTGSTGVLINVSLTWFFTEFYFGRQNYFYAYLIGLSANLIYNFVLHTKITFQTQKKHIQRFLIFAIYSLCMSVFQAWLIKLITPIIGVDYYLFVICGVILFFSVLNFFLFKLLLFVDK